MRFFIALLFVCYAGISTAQTFPNYENITVNDYAHLLNDEAQAKLSADLDALRKDTGVEMTVLTLPTQQLYAPDMEMEAFATALFNDWGIGDAKTNDGILVMILRDDRAMRIELGGAYGRDWDRTAAKIIDDHFIPSFSQGDFQTGIVNGSQAAMTNIARAFHAGEEAPSGGGSDSFGWLIMGGFGAFFAWAMGGRWLQDKMARFRKCPQCGQTGMRQSRDVISAATKTSTGNGMRRIRCTHCDYRSDIPYTISRIRSSSSSSFGGGSSGGGGASGRW